MAFPPAAGLDRRFTELQTFSDAFGHAGRLQSLVDAVHTIIAFDRFTRFRIPLGRAPRTGGDAALTSHTECLIHKNDAVFRAFLHGTGGTRRHTPRIFTVKAGYKNIGHPG